MTRNGRLFDEHIINYTLKLPIYCLIIGKLIKPVSFLVHQWEPSPAVPGTLVTQAIVPDHLRSAALGLNALFYRIFGTIPVPILAAKVRFMHFINILCRLPLMDPYFARLLGLEIFKMSKMVIHWRYETVRTFFELQIVWNFHSQPTQFWITNSLKLS